MAPQIEIVLTEDPRQSIVFDLEALGDLTDLETGLLPAPEANTKPILRAEIIGRVFTALDQVLPQGAPLDYLSSVLDNAEKKGLPIDYDTKQGLNMALEARRVQSLNSLPNPL